MYMNRNRRILWGVAGVLAAALAIANCGSDSGSTTAPAPAPTPAPTPAPEPEPAEMATYTIQYTPVFSGNPLFQALGAMPFPEGVTALDPLAFFAHPVDTMLWEPGGIATEGLKMLAETGESDAMLAEAMAMEFTVLANNFGVITAVLGAGEVTLSHDAPCLSYAQPLKPNADWFFGFANVCAVDEDGNWLEEVSLQTVMYDAGTAEGDPYMDATGATDPQQPIMKVETPPWNQAPVSIIVGTLKAE